MRNAHLIPSFIENRFVHNSYQRIIPYNLLGAFDHMHMLICAIQILIIISFVRERILPFLLSLDSLIQTISRESLSERG